MAEFDRARVPGHMSKGPPYPISGFLVIVANITVIEGTQQAVEIPIAIASVQETRTSTRELRFTETFRVLLSCFLFLL